MKEMFFIASVRFLEYLVDIDIKKCRLDGLCIQ